MLTPCALALPRVRLQGLMLQTLPMLPSLHWISMRLLYRDDKTPADYQPSGFDRSDDAALTFKSRPLQMAIGSACATAHHELRMNVISALLGDEEAPDEGIFEPAGVATQGQGKRARFEVDLRDAGEPGDFGAYGAASPAVPDGATAAGGALHAAKERERADEDAAAQLLPMARELVAEMAPGDAVTSALLSQHLSGATRLAAEAVLAMLESEGLVSPFMPALQTRLVRRERAEREETSGQSEAEQEASGQSASEGSPAATRTGAASAKRAASPTTPYTAKMRLGATTAPAPAPAPLTPARSAASPARRRKASRSGSVPSTPGRHARA